VGVPALADHFGLKASTYPGHQESRIGTRLGSLRILIAKTAASTGPALSPNMQRFADYLHDRQKRA
jgi:hypothetical protein